MILVVDANILFSFFKKDSFTRRFILSHPEIELFTPVYVFDELEEHKEEVKSKAKIVDIVFELSKKELLEYLLGNSTNLIVGTDTTENNR